MKKELPFLIISDSYRNPDIYYATELLVPDPFIYLKKGNRELIVVSSMELNRARKESKLKEVCSFSDFGLEEKSKKFGKEGFYEMVAELLKREKIREVQVPFNVAFGYVHNLQERRFKVHLSQASLTEKRVLKSPAEIKKIQETQMATERSCQRAQQVLEASIIGKNDLLMYEKKPLTSQRLRQEIEYSLMMDDCYCDGIIAAGGIGSADPHFLGEGSLKAHEPIVLDIFPYHKTNRYFADMTRTFVKGKPSRELKKMYDTVLKAQEAGINRVKEGVEAQKVHYAVCDVIEKAGYISPRNKAKFKKLDRPAFIHSTGHGLGLEVHESPSVSANPALLKAGQVITIEPGLYDPRIGGIRIEDLVVVTKSGCRNLTTYPKIFEIP